VYHCIPLLSVEWNFWPDYDCAIDLCFVTLTAVVLSCKFLNNQQQCEETQFVLTAFQSAVVA